MPRGAATHATYATYATHATHATHATNATKAGLKGKPQPPLAPEKSPEELRRIFLDANPDIDSKLKSDEYIEKKRQHHLLAVSELGPLDEPSRGYPLPGPAYAKEPSQRSITSGYQAMLKKQEKDIQRLKAHLKLAKPPRKSAPINKAERLTQPGVPEGNAFTLPAKELLQSTDSPRHRNIAGRIQQDLDRHGLNLESLEEFSVACQAFAYASGHRIRPPSYSGKHLKRLLFFILSESLVLMLEHDAFLCCRI